MTGQKWSLIRSNISDLCLHPSLIFAVSLLFTPKHNQTALCPALPYDQSMMTLACCCRGPTRSWHSGQQERAAAAPGGQQSTGRFPAQDAPPWAAAPLDLWGTRAEQGRTAHSPPPSSLCHSCWKKSCCLDGWKSLVLKVLFSIQTLSGVA